MSAPHQAIRATIFRKPSNRAVNLPYLSTSALVAALILAGLLLGCRPGDQGTPAEEGNNNQQVETVGEPQALMPTRRHLPESQNADYNTVPPTSGDHWDRWADCGFYPDGLPDERMVHNLEHSIIVINYNLATRAEVDELLEAAQSVDLYKTWGLTRFYDRIPEGTVVLAAWGMLDTIQGVDRERINRFFNAYAGNLGPERIPCEVPPSPMESG